MSVKDSVDALLEVPDRAILEIVCGTEMVDVLWISSVDNESVKV